MAADPVAVRPGIFGVRLEADRRAYSVGEPVRLRVTIYNRTSRDYSVFFMPIYYMSRLRISNDDGQTLAPKFIPGFAMALSLSMPNRLDLPPGKTLSSFADPRDSWRMKDWFDIRYWGYDLDRPGKYAISAVATMAANEKAADRQIEGQEFFTSPLDISNAVQITVKGPSAN